MARRLAIQTGHPGVSPRSCNVYTAELGMPLSEHFFSYDIDSELFKNWYAHCQYIRNGSNLYSSYTKPFWKEAIIKQKAFILQFIHKEVISYTNNSNLKV